MTMSEVEVFGRVARQGVDIGSKSEREAVVLTLDDGGHYVLRSANGPSFGDHSLDPLVGKSIKALGTLSGRTLIMRQWETLPDRLGD